MINEIFLKNFKCFDNVAIPVSNLTLLAGSNGSGKSSVIQSLLLLVQSYKKSNELNKLYFIGEYIKLGYFSDVFHEFNNEAEPVMEIGLKFTDNKSIKWSMSYESSALEISAAISGDTLDVSEGLFNDNFEYIAAERISPDKIFSVFRETSNLGLHGENVMNYLSKMASKPILENICIEKKENKLSTQVDAWLERLFDGFCVKFEEIIKADTISLRFQEVTQSDRSNERRPINVGFGITYVLPIIIALLKAQKGDLVIIENPESHLHPRAQRLLGELLAIVGNAGVQVIAETHSDHILNGIRVAVKNEIIDPCNIQILFTNRENVGNHYYTNMFMPRLFENGDLDIWPEGFFDEWDNAMINLLG